MAIRFHEESSKFNLSERKKIKSWLTEVVDIEGFVLGDVSVVLTDDKALLKLNKQFLSRDYLTDIITFDYSEGKCLSGELFISTDRIIENASKFSVSRKSEILRVIVHGILHLAGYKDSTDPEKISMREKENFYIQMILDGS